MKRLNAYKSSAPVASESIQAPIISSQQICDNCNQEVPSGTIDLHKAQCMRRITKCKACNLPVVSSQLENHFLSIVGIFADVVKDIETGNIESLGNREAHGCDFHIQDTDPGKNTLLHIAVKTGKREIVQFLLNKGLDINALNNFGETPLHVACGKNKDLHMVQFLVSKGSDFKIFNAMGDTAVEVAKRNGFHEAVLYFQQKFSGAGRPGSSYNSRPSTVSSNNYRIL